MTRACSASRAASVTSCPRCSSTHEKPVPHDPAPTTTTFTREQSHDAKTCPCRSQVPGTFLRICSGFGRTEQGGFRRGWNGSAGDEVDRHGDALEPELVTQLVLNPVAIVARHVTAG